MKTKTKRIALFIALLLLLATILYLLFWPTKADPTHWQAPIAPELEGIYQTNSELKNIERIGIELFNGPEDLYVAQNGDIYTGTLDGHIYKLNPTTGKITLIANTGGRPLGIATIDGGLIITDAKLGLLKLSYQENDAAPEITTLMASHNGKPLLFADDLVITSNNKVYFSDGSTRWGLEYAAEDVVEHQTTGRVFEYDLNTGANRILVDNLSFANGIALDKKETSIFINETGNYRIKRHWLQGEKTGQTEIFIDNLPGLPDNITFNGQNTLWVALFAPRDPLLDSLSDKPWIRKILFRLPKFMLPKPKNMSFVLGLDMDGNVKHNLQYDSAKAYAPVTCAVESSGYLYMGSLSAKGIIRYKLKQ